MSRIAVYKALYRLFGGFVADVVAAIDQVRNNSMKEQIKLGDASSAVFCVCLSVSGCLLLCVGYVHM